MIEEVMDIIENGSFDCDDLQEAMDIVRTSKSERVGELMDYLETRIRNYK